MKTSSKKPSLISPIFLIIFFSATNSPADELGVATGLNSCVYGSYGYGASLKPGVSTWHERYQKTDILNPIEVTYQKDFTKFFGIHSALQYSKRSTSETIQKMDIDKYGNPVDLGITKLEHSLNYLSLEISPIFFHKFNHLIINARTGISGDFYINKSDNYSGKNSVSRDINANPFVLSIVGGIGLGYIIKDRYIIGFNSSVLNNMTGIYKFDLGNTSNYYLNFHNVIYFGRRF